jgi:hypothetical protein
LGNAIQVAIVSDGGPSTSADSRKHADAALWYQAGVDILDKLSGSSLELQPLRQLKVALLRGLGESCLMLLMHSASVCVHQNPVAGRRCRRESHKGSRYAGCYYEPGRSRSTSRASYPPTAKSQAAQGSQRPYTRKYVLVGGKVEPLAIRDRFNSSEWSEGEVLE